MATRNSPLVPAREREAAATSQAIGALFDFLTGRSVAQISEALCIDAARVEALLRHALITYGFSAETRAVGERATPE